jgi:hypothetical protein
MKNTTLTPASISQSNYYADSFLMVSGEIFISGSSLFGTDVTLMENDRVSQRFICDNNGFFFFRMEYEKEYQIIVSKKGYAEKIISFNTKLNGYPARKRYYEFGVTLSPAGFNANADQMVFPAAIIKFHPKYGEFEHDADYMKMRIKQHAA